ncbi:hypothetical protein R6Q57_028053 [Mikania cordata]
MGRGMKSHRTLKDRAMNRVDDLQVMLMDLQYARKESRNIDMVVLEEQVHQMLKEWKKELDYEPSSPSSESSLYQSGSLGFFSPDISRLLQLCDEEDDGLLVSPKPEPDAHNDAVNNLNFQEHDFKLLDQYKDSHLGINTTGEQNTRQISDYFAFNLPPEFEPNCIGVIYGEDGSTQVTSFLSNICPPPSAFLGPKCGLWDCPRPTQGSRSERPVQWWCTSYCSSLHAVVAHNEGQPGMTPVIRPKGIELKDNLLFAALSAKADGKNVGVPECEGAATAKSPWNAPELFDLSVFEGETLREWLFFDKPRRAFESGNRKQRSLPDYNGRGWHESRKQVINESGWLKRSYYMDPQPMRFLEWHLYEYEINIYNACALYRLELKLVDQVKKNTKGKISSIHTSRCLGRPLVI